MAKRLFAPSVVARGKYGLGHLAPTMSIITPQSASFDEGVFEQLTNAVHDLTSKLGQVAELKTEILSRMADVLEKGNTNVNEE